MLSCFFFFNDTATDEIYTYLHTRALHDALPYYSEFHRRALAVIMRRIEGLASDYADRRLSRMPEGSRWSPVPAVVQVLLTRAWLRGAALADDPPHEQLRCILSDEMGAESDPTARCTPWREYLDRTKGWQDRKSTRLNSSH